MGIWLGLGKISIAQISIAQITIAQIAIAQNSIAPLVPTHYSVEEIEPLCWFLQKFAKSFFNRSSLRL